ncbi:hypothetical protein L1987_46710 [Smallanthus sonchifolius]|uniref:Uncharacterized protein n=1 Tax=Smallanthus sonchifolius TaxID=185202 RepID=A0ACB9FZX3_9ASTR|nr:hypothetical protein L1987_46710 [Smallanthus sonchifolius]
MCDASDYAVGAVLGQRMEKHFHPIYYANKTMNDAQEHYTTTEKELLAVVFAFVKFRSYLALDKKGAENVVVDHLSRLESHEVGDQRGVSVDDRFFIESLMLVTTQDGGCPWFADFAIYLVDGTLLKGMRHQQNKNFFADVHITFGMTHTCSVSEQTRCAEVFLYGTVEIKEKDGMRFKVNGHRLKHYINGPNEEKEGEIVYLEPPKE